MNELLVSHLAEMDWAGISLAMLPLIILFAAGVAVISIEWFLQNPKVKRAAAGAVTFIFVIAAIILSWNGWPQAGGVNVPLLSLDKLAVFSWMLVMVSLLASSMMFIGDKWDDQTGGLAGLIFSAFGACVAVTSSDLIMFFISFEIMTIGLIYAMSAQYIAREGFKIVARTFYLHIFASTFFVMGMVFIFGSSGTLELSSLAPRVFEIAQSDGRAFFLFGISMITIGFALKIAIFPFHLWFVDGACGARLPVASFFATGFLSASVIAFARFALACGIASTNLWQHTIAALALLTITLAMLAAQRENDLKKIFIYIAMAGAAFSLLAFTSMVKDPFISTEAVLINLTAGLPANIGVFAALKMFSPSFDLAKLSGVGKTKPIFALAFAILIASLAAFPFSFGFFGKVYILDAVSRTGSAGLIISSAIASALIFIVAIRLIVVMYFYGGAKTLGEQIPISKWLVVILTITALASIVFGIYPAQILSFIGASI